MSDFTVEDIPKILPTIKLDAPTDKESLSVAPVMGIPQSTAPPAGMMEVFGTAPWESDETAFNDATAKWYRDGTDKLDAAVLDPEKGFADIDLSFAPDPETARRQVVTDAWMDLNHDEPPAPDSLQRRVQFQVASLARFGEMVDSEEALYPLIQKDATQRKDAKALADELQTTARVSATVGNLGETGGTFQAWKDTAKKHPGYNQDADPDYFEAWHQVQRQAKEHVAPYKAELSQVWKAMKAGGAGSPSEVLKSVGADLLLGGGADGQDTIDELQKKDAGAMAYEFYDQLPEQERAGFMDGLAVLIQQFPKEQRPALLATWGKSFGSVVDDMFRGAASRFTVKALEQELNQGIADSAGPFGASAADKAKASTNAATLADERLKQKNFMDAVRKMERDEYAPTQFYSDPSKDVFSTRTLEQGFYGSASAIASVAVMATPVIGYPTLALAMEDFAYSDLRDNAMRSGATEMDASRFARDNQTLAAVPQLGIEILQNNLALGKLPFANKVLMKLGDGIKNRLLRGVVKAGAVATAETTVEEIQFLTPYAVQELSHALEMDTGISAAVWSNGNNGALDGFWTRQATTFLSMLPLAGSAAIGGLNQEARNAAFARATTTELQAIGGTEEGIAAINAANGPSSMAAAIEVFRQTQDSNSETAKTAVGIIEEKLKVQRQAAEDIEKLGYGGLPIITSRVNGTYSVTDRITGEELGIASDMAGVERLVNTHTAALDGQRADYIAEMATMLLSGKILSELTGDENQFDLDRVYSVSEAAAKNPKMAERIAEEIRLVEEAGGGTGDMALVVFGEHGTELRNGVKQDVNKLYNGAHLGTLLEETVHGRWRKARAKGLVTREEDISLIRGFDEVLAKATNGKAVRFIPEGMADADVNDIRIEEAIGQLAQMEIFRTPKNGKNKFNLPRNVVSAHIGAVGQITGQGTAFKFKSFMNAMRARMGLVMSRAFIMKKAEKAGEFDYATFDAYLDKILGLDQQTEHDAGVVSELDRILGLPDEIADDDIPFSIGTRYLDGNSRANGEGSYNYVIFSDSDIEIVEENGTPVDLGEASYSIGPNQSLLQPLIQGAGMNAETEISREGNFRTFAADYATSSGRLYRFVKVDDEEKIISGLEVKMKGPRSKSGVIVAAYTADDQRRKGHAGSLLRYAQKSFQVKHSTDLTNDGRAFKKADGVSYSIGLAKVADIMAGNALKRITDPRRRTQVMSRIARDFDAMRLQIDRMASLSGVRRSKGDLRREAMAREDLRAEELIADVHRRFGEIMADEDLVKIKSQPVHAALADPTSPLRGRLKSKAAAIREHPDMFQLHRAGDYDGSDGVSRSVFGGQRMPDQAAQELYDAGLIPEPTADALWEALLSEQKTVKGMKELLQKATEQIREAKAQAKQEANEWLATQGKDQEVNFSDKEEIRRSLRMLDAILLALPPEIRGKIGGYTQISMIGTDEARLGYLKDKLAKADKELETFLRVEYAAEWEALLKKAAPATNEPGQRPTGSIAADAYDIFRVAEAAMGMSFRDGEIAADGWDAIADHPDTDPKDVDMARVKAQMIRLTMNWTAADAARREQAVLEGEKIYYQGLLALKIENSRRRERLGKLRNSAISGTGSDGSRMARKAAEVAAKGNKAREALQTAWEFLSFGQVVNVLFGENSAAARWFNARELAASNAFEDAFQAKANAIEALFTTLAGSRFGGEALKFRMSTVDTITVKDARGEEHTFTDSAAITFLLMWRQEDGQRHMRGLIDEETGAILSEWAWDDASAAAIEKQLSPQAQAAMAFLGQSYGEEYGRINAVFRRIWNVSMPRHKMYSPLSVAPVQGKGDTIMDPVSGDMMGVGMTPGSLKNRSFSAIAEPLFKDAFQVYVSHARQMEHFIAYGEFARDALAVVNRRETRNAIEAAGGPFAAGVLSKWLDFFAVGGVKDANLGGATSRVIGGVLGRLSQAELVGRISVLAMQSLQLAAAAHQMPVGAYLTRLAKLGAGRLDWSAAVGSEYIQRRMLLMPPIVRDAVQGLASGTPNRAKYYAAELGKTISGADALFTGGTYAIFYDYHLKLAKDAKMANPEAHAHSEAERLTDQVAQPVRIGARSWLEVANQGNAAFRAMWNFSSDPRQKMALVIYQAMRKDKKGTEKAAALGKALTLTWIGGGVLAAVLRAAMRDLRDDDDDELFDERHWNPKRLALMALNGPLGGMPYLGEVIEGRTYALTGEYMPAGGMLAGIGQSVQLIPKWLEGDFDLLKDAEKIFTDGAAVSGTSAAAASAMHILRDAWGIIENLEGPE